MMHASRLGIDSHGVRLTPHYARVLRSGRVNPHPKLESRRTAAASAVVDADNGLGHPAAYAGMELAGELVPWRSSYDGLSGVSAAAAGATVRMFFG
jgi:ureidoglycolate dehydrogenase (NAD+)